MKAVRLRDVVSQGLALPVSLFPELGSPEPGKDYAGELGIKKHVPRVPVAMQGQMEEASEYTLAYDIENIKKYPDLLSARDLVDVTEKLHGTFVCMGIHPHRSEPIVFSKGQGAKGLVFKLDAEVNEKNIYVRMFRAYREQLKALAEMLKPTFYGAGAYVMGEIVGRGVQDLDYGHANPTLRVFDVCAFWGGKSPVHHDFILPASARRFARQAGFECVPALYRGEWQGIAHLVNGESVEGGEHMREGVVIRSAFPRKRRIILKAINDDYLLRKGGTEYE